jgi:hypothetical protein
MNNLLIISHTILDIVLVFWFLNYYRQRVVPDDFE